MLEGGPGVSSDTITRSSTTSVTTTTATTSTPSFYGLENGVGKESCQEPKRRRSFEKRQEREDEIRLIAKRCKFDECVDDGDRCGKEKGQEEVNREFQEVYIGDFRKRQIREEKEWLELMRRIGRRKSYCEGVVGDDGEKVLGCKHYRRKCKLLADCCGVFVTCRLCHDEEERCMHELVRKNTKRVLCMVCDLEQDVGKICKGCGVVFGEYFCEVCKFFDSTPEKDIYHCDKCGICRLGKGLGIDNIHCDECNGCISKERYGKHKCLPKSLLGQCPICSGELFTTMKDTYTLRCGHWIHSECCDSYRQTYRNYTCPICHKSMYDLSEKFLVDYFAEIDAWLAEHQMPEEYKNRLSYIYCYDCEKKSVVPYHFVFHKCANPQCRSYNCHTEHVFAKGEPPPAENAFICKSLVSQQSEAAAQQQIPQGPKLASTPAEPSTSAVTVGGGNATG